MRYYVIKKNYSSKPILVSPFVHYLNNKSLWVPQVQYIQRNFMLMVLRYYFNLIILTLFEDKWLIERQLLSLFQQIILLALKVKQFIFNFFLSKSSK